MARNGGEMSNRTESYAKPGMQSEQELGKLTFFSILREGKVCQLNYTLFGTASKYGTARVSDSYISYPSIGTVFQQGRSLSLKAAH